MAALIITRWARRCLNKVPLEPNTKSPGIEIKSEKGEDLKKDSDKKPTIEITSGDFEMVTARSD